MFFKNRLEIVQIPQRVWQPRLTGGFRNMVRGDFTKFPVESGPSSFFF